MKPIDKKNPQPQSKDFTYSQNLFFSIIVIFILSGCSTAVPSHEQRVQIAKEIVTSDITQKNYKTSDFNFFTYSSLAQNCKKKSTNIYIEGDGLAWITSSRISDDPTPINPLALKMFMQDESKCKLYIARPCQYVSSSICSEKQWTSHRFSKEVIESYDEVIDKIKIEKNLKEFRLIGYSGGGAIVALVAARRSDVNMLVSVAGNLDTDYWTQMHHISPLYGSLNPANFSDELQDIKQLHFIEEEDNIVDKSVFESYAKRFKNNKNIKYKIVKNYTHNCCWSDEWASLLKESY